MDEHVVAALHRIGRAAQVLGGHPLQERRRGQLRRHTVGHRDCTTRIDGNLLRIAPGGRDPRHPISVTEPLDAISHRRDDPRALDSGDHRRLAPVGARALSLVHVSVVDADRFDVHQQLAIPGLRRRLVAGFEHLGPPVPGDHDRAHAAVIPFARWRPNTRVRESWRPSG